MYRTLLLEVIILITGNDNVSMEILESYEQGVKVKDIPVLFPVSLDQAKRLSRYHKILQKTKGHLHASSLEKIKILGLKSLYLAPLYTKEDWQGLDEILQSVNKDTKRNELPLLLESLREKREGKSLKLEEQTEGTYEKSMKISRVINNNVASVINKKKQELVIMGKGIAFQKKVGDTIDEDKVEKVFSLESEEVSERFKKLLNEIPMEYMDVSEEIIQYAKMNIGKKLNDIIYVSLTDHIYFAVERHKKGMDLKNGLIWETKRMYKDEFAIGKEALKIIEKKLGVTLLEDEATFIALHIVNAELNEEIPTIINITKVMQEILDIVKYHFHMDFDEESLYYYRFITHLKFFAQRIFHGEKMSGNDNFLYEMVKSTYTRSYQCTEKIKNLIEEEYSYYLTNDEMLYLTIHIERVASHENTG